MSESKQIFFIIYNPFQDELGTHCIFPGNFDAINTKGRAFWPIINVSLVWETELQRKPFRRAESQLRFCVDSDCSKQK